MALTASSQPLNTVIHINILRRSPFKNIYIYKTARVLVHIWIHFNNVNGSLKSGTHMQTIPV